MIKITLTNTYRFRGIEISCPKPYFKRISTWFSVIFYLATRGVIILAHLSQIYSMFGSSFSNHFQVFSGNVPKILLFWEDIKVMNPLHLDSWASGQQSVVSRQCQIAVPQVLKMFMMNHIKFEGTTKSKNSPLAFLRCHQNNDPKVHQGP